MKKTIAACLAASLLAGGCDDKPAGRRPPADWNAWAVWVETQQPVADASGHGPDIGSDEWARGLDRRLGISDGAGHGPDIGSDEWRGAVERKLMPREGQR